MSQHGSRAYAKRDRDFYPTPLQTVKPLIPWLRKYRVTTFSEPCSGEGDLVRHLESFGLRCQYAGDINTGRDALRIPEFEAPVITNPPFSRGSTKLLLDLTAHFTAAAPSTWLLLPLAKMKAAHMQLALRHCSDIVDAGRDCWLDNGETGTTDLAWFRFDQSHQYGPLLRCGDPVRVGVTSVLRCEGCGERFTTRRRHARTCSDACRQRRLRLQKSGTTV